MQTINTWSELAQLALPINVKTSLIKHLLEPFQTETVAEALRRVSDRNFVGEIEAGHMSPTREEI